MKKESKIKILLPILAVIIVTVLIFNRLLFKLKDQVDKVVLPIQSKVYNVANRAISLKDIIFSYEDIIAENENLKKENMELKIQKERNQKILEENERLSKLLEMKENTIYKGSLKFARVSFSDINNLNNKIFIDLGKKDGIKVDMIAVYGDYLVGKIENIDDKENDSYKRITIKPPFESKDLRELIVIGHENTINKPIVKEEETEEVEEKGEEGK